MLKRGCINIFKYSSLIYKTCVCLRSYLIINVMFYGIIKYTLAVDDDAAVKC